MRKCDWIRKYYSLHVECACSEMTCQLRANSTNSLEHTRKATVQCTSDNLSEHHVSFPLSFDISQRVSDHLVAMKPIMHHVYTRATLFMAKMRISFHSLCDAFAFPRACAGISHCEHACEMNEPFISPTNMSRSCNQTAETRALTKMQCNSIIRASMHDIRQDTQPQNWK